MGLDGKRCPSRLMPPLYSKQSRAGIGKGLKIGFAPPGESCASDPSGEMRFFLTRIASLFRPCLVEFLSENSITFIKGTPSLFNMLVNCTGFNDFSPLSSLRLIVLGGEKIRVNDLEVSVK